MVIGIIALLIGILLPSLNRAREASKMIACLSNMRQMGTASTFFVNERDGWMYKAWNNSGPKGVQLTGGSWGYAFPRWGWDFVLGDTYLSGSKDVFACPSDDRTNIVRGVQFDPPDSGDAEATGARFGDARLPADYKTSEPIWESDNYPASYRYNASSIPWPDDAQKLVQIPEGTQAILVGEGEPARHHHLASWETGLAEIGQGTLDNVPERRHVKGRLNYMFYDGHGETLTWEQSWKPLGQPFEYTASFSLEGPLTKTVTPTRWRTLYPGKFPSWQDINPYDPTFEYPRFRE